MVAVIRCMSRLASTSRVSLEDWDALAGLTARENESIARMQDAIQSKSLPVRAAAAKPCTC